MNTIKKVNKTRIKLNGKSYKGYMLGDLPPTFSYIKKEIETDDGVVTDFGIREWFNYKGLTYIKN